MGSKTSGVIIVGLGLLLGLHGLTGIIIHLMALTEAVLPDGALVRHFIGIAAGFVLVALAHYCVRSGLRRMRPPVEVEPTGGRPDRAWLGLGTGALVVLLLSPLSPSDGERDRGQQRIAVAEMRRAVDSVRQAASEGAPAAPPAAAAPVATGEAGQMERLFKSMLARAQADRHSYETEMQALGISQLIDPERLKADRSLEASRATLQRARETIARYRARTDTLLADTRHEIEGAELRPATRRAALTAFDDSAPRNKAQAQANWDLEARQLEEIAAVVDLLGSRRGAWQSRGGKFVFQRQADLDLFNAHMKNIATAADRQRQSQLDRLQRVSDGLRPAQP